MDTFESILKSLQGVAPRPYTPAFRLEAVGDAWRVFDGDRQLAKFYPLFLVHAYLPLRDENIRTRQYVSGCGTSITP